MLIDPDALIRIDVVQCDPEFYSFFPLHSDSPFLCAAGAVNHCRSPPSTASQSDRLHPSWYTSEPPLPVVSRKLSPRLPLFTPAPFPRRGGSLCAAQHWGPAPSTYLFCPDGLKPSLRRVASRTWLSAPSDDWRPGRGPLRRLTARPPHGPVSAGGGLTRRSDGRLRARGLLTGQ